MKNLKLIISAALLVIATMGCKSKYELLINSANSEEKYAAAFDYFNMGKYPKAARLFENLSVVTTGTERDDTVQYYWALSNYRNQDFYTATANFDHFIETHPESVFSEDAQFLKIDCMYRATYRYELDQTPTYKAITAISEYIINNIDSPHIPACNRMLDDLNERLDRKAFENAYIYYKMEDYKAASVALKNVLKDDSDNIYREKVLFYSAMASYKYAFMSVPDKQRERYQVFVDDYYNFISEYPDSEYRKNLDDAFAKYKKIETKL